MLKSVFVPINRAGWPFIVIFAVVTAGLGYFSDIAGWVGVILTLWCVYFFRDPDRVTPTRDGLIISPADGVVQSIGKFAPPPELHLGDAPRTRIAIFMNVFDVHVNRVPIGGKITRQVYRPGKFFNASLDKASEFNERQALAVKTAGGLEIGFVQIAGLIARRIICDVSVDQELKTGERFGLIRFGSRVDVYLPDNIPALVTVGQRAVAGETVIADVKSKENNRDGEVR